MADFNFGEEFDGLLPEEYDKLEGISLRDKGILKGEQTLDLYYAETREEFLKIVTMLREEGAVLEQFSVYGKGEYWQTEEGAKVRATHEEGYFEKELTYPHRQYPNLIEVREPMSKEYPRTMNFISYDEMVHCYEVPNINVLNQKFQRDFNKRVHYGTELYQMGAVGTRDFKGTFYDEYKYDHLDKTNEAMNAYLKGNISKEEAFELVKESYLKNTHTVSLGEEDERKEGKDVFK